MGQVGAGGGGSLPTILVAVTAKPQRQPHTSHMACNCFAGATATPAPALINCHTHTHITYELPLLQLTVAFCQRVHRERDRERESRRHMTLGCKIYKLVARNVTCKISSAATCFLRPAAAAKTLRNMQLN